MGVHSQTFPSGPFPQYVLDSLRSWPSVQVAPRVPTPWRRGRGRGPGEASGPGSCGRAFLRGRCGGGSAAVPTPAASSRRPSPPVPANAAGPLGTESRRHRATGAGRATAGAGQGPAAAFFRRLRRRPCILPAPLTPKAPAGARPARGNPRLGGRRPRSGSGAGPGEALGAGKGVSPSRGPGKRQRPEGRGRGRPRGGGGGAGHPPASPGPAPVTGPASESPPSLCPQAVARGVGRQRARSRRSSGRLGRRRVHDRDPSAGDTRPRAPQPPAVRARRGEPSARAAPAATTLPHPRKPLQAPPAPRAAVASSSLLLSSSLASLPSGRRSHSLHPQFLGFYLFLAFAPLPLLLSFLFFAL